MKSPHFVILVSAARTMRFAVVHPLILNEAARHSITLRHFGSLCCFPVPACASDHPGVPYKGPQGRSPARRPSIDAPDGTLESARIPRCSALIHS